MMRVNSFDNSPINSGKRSLVTPSTGPTFNCRTRTPGEISTISATSLFVRRVKISTCTPIAAIRSALSVT